jgi:hypothetical protein
MQKWRNILINFIVDLPNSNKFINIMVVVDRLIKMQYIISIKLINAISVAEYFIKYIFKLYRLPNSIVYNYSTYCTNHVPTCSVHQVRVYAFSAPTTRLRVWYTPKTLA